jgi:hypothetical protein
VPGTSAPRKADAIEKTAEKAQAHPEAVTVKIHKQNGRI